MSLHLVAPLERKMAHWARRMVPLSGGGWIVGNIEPPSCAGKTLNVHQFLA